MSRQLPERPLGVSRDKGPKVLHKMYPGMTEFFRVGGWDESGCGLLLARLATGEEKKTLRKCKRCFF